jgi:two-component system, OmpR family, alkaline phosphatase synthesis response regulator PhoP
MGKEGRKILLIDDEPGLVMTLTDRLRNEGYIVIHAGDGVKGEKAALEYAPDLVILEVMLLGKGGFDVCRDLRSQGVNMPIMMLTARGHVNEKVVGLKLGADDYMTKPFDMLELLARVESLLRRPPSLRGSASTLHEFSFGSVTVDFCRLEVTRKGKLVGLSSKEFQLLRHFIENRCTALSRESILNAVWGYESMPTTRTIDTHVVWLRQKLEENSRRPQYFLTVHGLGYKFAG